MNHKGEPLGKVLFKYDINYMLLKYFFDRQGQMLTLEDIWSAGFGSHKSGVWDSDKRKHVEIPSKAMQKSLLELQKQGVLFRDNDYYMYTATDQTDKEVRGILGLV